MKKSIKEKGEKWKKEEAQMANNHVKRCLIHKYQGKVN